MTIADHQLSDTALRLATYDGPDGFSVWRDDTPEGIILIGIIWDQRTESGQQRESWDAYGSIAWPKARKATGYDLASARRQARDMLAQNDVISTDADENWRRWLSSTETMPVVASAQAFIPALAV